MKKKSSPIKTIAQALAFFDKADAKLASHKMFVAPEGFFTAAELAKKKGCSAVTMRTKLNEMVASGLAEVTIGRTKTTSVRYFRILPQK